MTLDSDGVAHTTKVYSFVFKPNLEEINEYWLGLLNSKLMWFFISNTGYILRGGYFTFKTNYLTPFPIKRIDFENESEVTQYEKIVELVRKTMDLKRNGSAADVSVHESQIDEIFMALYDLTDEEKNIIRNS